MRAKDDIRPNEVAVDAPERVDAGLVFIGVIRTPWATRAECPHYGRPDGPVCQIEVFEPWDAALDGVEALERIEVFYWLHMARRDLVRQNPGRDRLTKATFTIRSPVRPNPIGTSIVTLVAREGPVLHVRGLDCVDRTPLLDLKPDRSMFRSATPDEDGS
jgi:tRNA-Thr(GGU) m(6)t(6)A37 methyltransferase TsaA